MDFLSCLASILRVRFTHGRYFSLPKLPWPILAPTQYLIKMLLGGGGGLSTGLNRWCRAVHWVKQKGCRAVHWVKQTGCRAVHWVKQMGCRAVHSRTSTAEVKNEWSYKPPPMVQQPPVGQAILIIKASRSCSDTPHSVGLPWTSDQPVAETSTWQHTTLLRHIQTQNPSKREAAEPRLRPRGHGDWRIYNVFRTENFTFNCH